MGIKGVGMGNLAIFLKLMGEEVQGSDVKGKFPTDPLLAKYGIKVFEEFSKENLRGVDKVIFTGAHQGVRNPEVVWAKKQGIPVFHFSEFIGREVLPEFKIKVAVAGTHGKTTTSSLVVWSLLKLNKPLGYLVGAPFFNKTIEGVGFTGKEVFVLEADEYAKSSPVDTTPKFFEYKNLDYILLPTLDFDHPDVYKDERATILAFEKFLTLNPNAIVIYNLEDPNLAELMGRIKNKKFSYGRGDRADVRIGGVEFSPKLTKFSLHLFGNRVSFEIELFGYHNVLNSTAVITLLYLLNNRLEEIGEALKGFSGADRRLEFKGRLKDKLVFDDYAHHPTEIKATMDALRKAFPEKKILLIFQPHTFSRTFALKEKFILALQEADRIILLPIFPSAREKPQEFNISSKQLVEMLVKKGKKAKLANSFEEAAKIAKESQDIDIILTAGAGDVYKCLNYFNG